MLDDLEIQSADFKFFVQVAVVPWAKIAIAPNIMQHKLHLLVRRICKSFIGIEALPLIPLSMVLANLFFS